MQGMNLTQLVPSKPVRKPASSAASTQGQAAFGTQPCPQSKCHYAPCAYAGCALHIPLGAKAWGGGLEACAVVLSNQIITSHFDQVNCFTHSPRVDHACVSKRSRNSSPLADAAARVTDPHLRVFASGRRSSRPWREGLRHRHRHRPPYLGGFDQRLQYRRPEHLRRHRQLSNGEAGMPAAKPKVSRKVPRSAYVVLPFFGLWTAANVYFGLSERYGGGGPAFGPRKTKFMIDEGASGEKQRAAAAAAAAAGGAAGGAAACSGPTAPR
eukprot:364259-Chlamydomonas_euryale.AAC.10